MTAISAYLLDPFVADPTGPSSSQTADGAVPSARGRDRAAREGAGA